MTNETFNQHLMEFLDHSPTPFHAAESLATGLREAGFDELDEAARWSIEPGGKYFVTRGDASLIAFSLGPEALPETGLQMVGSHTDSPCLKLKPNAAFKAHGYWQLGVEVYGAALLNPWFDRDLSLAGRVTLQPLGGGLIHRLVDFERALAIIPSLAIHLDRRANKKRSINSQTHLPAIVCIDGGEFDLEREIADRVVAADPDLGEVEVTAFDLSLYPTEKAALVGLRDEFIASARLDNLLSCYVGARALTEAPDTSNCLIACNDHEEVGSGSATGARGTFLSSILERLTETSEAYGLTIARSTLVSTDNAHGIHPNFADRHDDRHGPRLNGGPVIKINSNQAYASNSETTAIFKQACRAAGVPVQSFVARTDMACGSTIGPLTATALGVKTVDVGVPTFAMHSIREIAGSEDAFSLYRALRWFFGRREEAVANPGDEA
ncbi:MAG TPA: M18 family aminopeptidase [Gammaproteobacteria bacterium]|nr:M18 family aminopeptidase [Gammaproteobacteria bacterium]